MNFVRGVATATLLAVAIAPAAQAQAPDTVTGRPTARDADTLRFGDQVVFLWGIESMEPGQVCFIGNQMWACYFAALRSLETIIGVAEVTCELTGEPDYLGRRLGNCFVAGQNVAEAQVRAGFAVAKRDETLDYVDEEEAAEAEKIGLWQGDFQPPAEFRASEYLMERP